VTAAAVFAAPPGKVTPKAEEFAPAFPGVDGFVLA